MAIGAMIVAHQCLCQSVTDDLAVQIVEIPLVLHEQRASLPLNLKSVLALIHAGEFYLIRRMNGI